MDWLNLLAVQGTLKSLLQHHSSKASILQPHSGGGYIQIESHSSLNTRLGDKILNPFLDFANNIILNNLTELFKFQFLHLYNEYFGWDKVVQL